jgi:exodeoxyribonuclease VII large subunit
LVAELCGLLEGTYPKIWVQGEVSNFTEHKASGHWYFTLKDDEAQIRAVMFRGSNLRCRFTPQNGMAVVACARVSVYEPRGEMQLQVLWLEKAGLGTAEQRKRELIEQLRKRGFFDAERKRPLPPYPRRVALVTSAYGAAVRDMLELFSQRWPLTELIVRHSTVQGESAAEELAQALTELNQLHRSGRLPLDVIILARGGGSSEDLSAFDTLEVAEAIYRSQVPIVSAVGHEINVTIADLVADERAETPSAAVMRVVPHRSEKLRELEDLAQRLHQAITDRLASRNRELERLTHHPGWRQPQRALRQFEQRLDELSDRLPAAMRRHLQQARQHCDHLAARLEALSPWRVLQRGYSLTVTAEGQILRHARQLQPGQTVRTWLAEGAFTSCVTNVQTDAAPLLLAENGETAPRQKGETDPASPTTSAPARPSSPEAHVAVPTVHTQEEA